VAEQALYQGIAQVKAGNCLLDIAGAIEDYVKTNGYSVVEDYTGHGVGRNLHEEPAVFNFRTNQLPNVRLRPGMTLAIEPIVNAGTKHTRVLIDRWTVVTLDNALSAQFEHTVLVTEGGCEILTDRHKV
jgi:methionyl aminopeptidase